MPGLRRGEMGGLKWSDIDRDADTVTIARSRVLVDGQVIKKSPKSKRSCRTLPLFSQLTGAIRALDALETVELEERDRAGAAYANSGCVAADELGQPVRPDWYSREFTRICLTAEVPMIRLHDTRGTLACEAAGRRQAGSSADPTGSDARDCHVRGPAAPRPVPAGPQRRPGDRAIRYK